MPLFAQSVCPCVRARELACSCSKVQQMPQVEASLECVPDHQLAQPYLAVPMLDQLACSLYLLAAVAQPRSPASPPLLCHLSHRDPGSSPLSGCRQAFNDAAAAANEMAATSICRRNLVVFFFPPSFCVFGPACVCVCVCQRRAEI